MFIVNGYALKDIMSKMISRIFKYILIPSTKLQIIQLWCIINSRNNKLGIYAEDITGILKP